MTHVRQMPDARGHGARAENDKADARFTVAVFEGDGIGPEIMRPTLELLEAIARTEDFSLVFDVVQAGAAHFRDHGEALPAPSLEVARSADAILLAAMGLPDIRYADGTEISPQIDLRNELGLFAGVRPVFLRKGKNAPVRAAKDKDIDFVIVRESTEGLFASRGRGIVDGDREARETMVITRAVSEKLFDFAFRLARDRRASGAGRGVVHCVDKANVFQAFAFFRKVFFERAAHFGDLEVRTAYVDAAALWMVQKPHMFDVMVTENMFGDILSDLGAGLMGSLGLAPSADIGEHHAVFQPCHGSAPDIAGQGMANPMAMILSAAMMLEWIGKERDVAVMSDAGQRLRGAVLDVVDRRQVLTPDLGGAATTRAVSEAVMGAYMMRAER